MMVFPPGRYLHVLVVDSHLLAMYAGLRQAEGFVASQGGCLLAKFTADDG